MDDDRDSASCGPRRALLGRRLGGAAAAGSLVGIAALGAACGWEASALALLMVVAALVGYSRPFLLGPLAVVLLPAAERFAVCGVQVSVFEAAIGGGALGYAARLATRPEERRFALAHWLFVALVAAIALSVFGAADDSDRLRDLILWLILGAVFHSVTTQLDDRRRARYLLPALAAALLFEACFALWEYADGWSERFSLLGGAIVFPLPEGTLEHANALGQFLVLGTLLLLALTAAASRLATRLSFAVTIVASIALAVTFSRGSWIALCAGGLVLLLDRRLRRPVLAAGGLVVVGGASLAIFHGGAIGARITSLFEVGGSGLADFRLELISRGAHVAAEHPLGVGRFQEAGIYAGRADVASHPHNLLLGTAVFFGILAALVLAWLLALAFGAAWRRLGEPAETSRRAGVGLLAVLVALVVNGLFEYPFWNPALATLIVVCLGSALEGDAGSCRTPRLH